MPQMMPMLWTLLLIFFIMNILVTSAFMYFNFIPYPSSLKSNKNIRLNLTKWNWKW